MDILEYIDNYYTGTRTPVETAAFEERVMKDPEFAEAVAFYLSVIQTARVQNAENKKEHFRKLYAEGRSEAEDAPVRRLWPYFAAAAAVIAALFFGLSFYMQPHQPDRLADEYIKDHLQKIGVKMSADLDALEAGKVFYNNGNYRAALAKFQTVIQHDTANYEAVEFAGLSALQLNDFDGALASFTRMEDHHELYVNHGKFYHALTLMKRNGPGDKQQARKLLEEVRELKLAGREDAEMFLKDF